MKKSTLLLVNLSVALAILAGIPGVSSSEDLYRNKTLRFIVGFSSGGGFDVYSRAIARHINKHVPGHPTAVVVNMPGAGSLIAANHVYNVARPDGLTIGNVIGGLLLGQVLGRPGIQFDGAKFEYIGTPTRQPQVCALTKSSGITSYEAWMGSKTPVTLGGTGPGTSTEDAPKILRAALGLPIQIVSGYKGIADIQAAAERGELDGGCWGWHAMRVTWGEKIKSGAVQVILQLAPRPDPELPRVPLAIDKAKNEEARQLIQTGIHDVNQVTFVYAIPPGSPRRSLEILRKAFQDTMKDPSFLSDAQKANLNVDPLNGEELEKVVSGLFTLSPSVISKLKDILAAK